MWFTDSFEPYNFFYFFTSQQGNKTTFGEGKWVFSCELVVETQEDGKFSVSVLCQMDFNGSLSLFFLFLK